MFGDSWWTFDEIYWDYQDFLKFSGFLDDFRVIFEDFNRIFLDFWVIFEEFLSIFIDFSGYLEIHWNLTGFFEGFHPIFRISGRFSRDFWEFSSNFRYFLGLFKTFDGIFEGFLRISIEFSGFLLMLMAILWILMKDINNSLTSTAYWQSTLNQYSITIPLFITAVFIFNELCIMQAFWLELICILMTSRELHWEPRARAHLISFQSIPQ